MNKATAEITRYNPSIDEGLSNKIVNQRIKENLVNKVKNKTSKSYLNIFTGNIFTFFNLLGLIVFVAYLMIGTDLSNYFFVIFYLIN